MFLLPFLLAGVLATSDFNGCCTWCPSSPDCSDQRTCCINDNNHKPEPRCLSCSITQTCCGWSDDPWEMQCCDTETEDCCNSCDNSNSFRGLVCVPKGTCDCGIDYSHCCGTNCCPKSRSCKDDQCDMLANDYITWSLFGSMICLGGLACLMGCCLGCRGLGGEGNDEELSEMNVEPLISTEEDPDLYCCCITALNSGIGARMFFITCILFRTAVYIMFVRHDLLFLAVLANILKVFAYFTTKWFSFPFYVIGVIVSVYFYCVPYLSSDFCAGYKKNEDIYFATAQAAYISAILTSIIEVPIYGTRKKFGCYYALPNFACLYEWKHINGDSYDFFGGCSGSSSRVEGNQKITTTTVSSSHDVVKYEDGISSIRSYCCLCGCPYLLLNAISISCSIALLTYFMCFQ